MSEETGRRMIDNMLLIQEAFGKYQTPEQVERRVSRLAEETRALVEIELLKGRQIAKSGTHP